MGHTNARARVRNPHDESKFLDLVF